MSTRISNKAQCDTPLDDAQFSCCPNYVYSSVKDLEKLDPPKNPLGELAWCRTVGILQSCLGQFYVYDYWAEKKFTLKKTCAQHTHSLNRTGDGVADEIPSLTPIDQRLVAVMGGPQFAAGDSHVAVNPFPSTINSKGGLASESIRASMAYLKTLQSTATLQSLVTPSPVQIFGSIKWHNRTPTIYVKLIQVLSVPRVLQMKDTMDRVIGFKSCTSKR